MTQLTATLSGIEAGPWTSVTGPSINPQAADWYDAQALPASVLLSMYSSKPYGAVLWKNVQPLPWQAANITLCYSLRTDTATGIYGQVCETDMKITDAVGWTYDGSFQWNIAAGWQAQVGNPWFNLGFQIPAPIPGLWDDSIRIHYQIDYAAHTIAVVGVDAAGTSYVPTKVTPIAAKQAGWAPSQIVTQLQLCNNAKPGAYSLEFGKIGYVFS